MEGQPVRPDQTPVAPDADPVGRRRWVRLGAKTLHDVASITFGGALAACLVINQVASRESAAEFAAATGLAVGARFGH